MRAQRMRDLFDADPKRAAAMSLTVAGLHLDYSKNLITQETLGLLIDLAEKGKELSVVASAFIDFLGEESARLCRQLDETRARLTRFQTPV